MTCVAVARFFFQKKNSTGSVIVLFFPAECRAKIIVFYCKKSSLLPKHFSGATEPPGKKTKMRTDSNQNWKYQMSPRNKPQKFHQRWIDHLTKRATIHKHYRKANDIFGLARKWGRVCQLHIYDTHFIDTYIFLVTHYNPPNPTTNSHWHWSLVLMMQDCCYKITKQMHIHSSILHKPKS
jgi:hypothetical protein